MRQIESEQDIDRLELVTKVKRQLVYLTGSATLATLIQVENTPILTIYLNRYYDTYSGILPDAEILNALKFYANNYKEVE
ncbi:hypothetical protein RND61_14775 [Streptomyces sp. TRM76323]|uniref:Uncharacterized protein n=1 Tax=Streptomyces tamarix TaxID=3078565 RepID=A0ABU3QKP6_9ACTN|nr:hypothetical protein [Streptomyces tamarix]MDT9683327.1 hypothetical protein [Streptomyces tamarix]